MVVVVVLNYRQAAMTLRCIDSVRLQGDVRVLLVDNGSGDGCLEAFAGAGLGGVEIIPLGRNLGFAGGMNAGIRAAVDQGADLIWLLNNDAFPQKGCLAGLCDHLRDRPRTALVTPRIRTTEGDDQHVGGSIDWSGETSGGLLGVSELGNLMVGRGLWITGCAPLIRSEALREVGGFDERFFAYWEDVDLSMRLSGRGWLLEGVQDVEVTHLGGATSGGNQSEFTDGLLLRNNALLLQKHLPAGRSGPAIWQVAARIARRIGERRASQGALQSDHLLKALYGVLFDRYGDPEGIRLPFWFRLLFARSAYRWQRLFERQARRRAAVMAG